MSKFKKSEGSFRLGFIVFHLIVKRQWLQIILIRYVFVYEKHMLAGQDIQYWAPDSQSRHTTPIDKIKVIYIAGR